MIRIVLLLGLLNCLLVNCVKKTKQFTLDHKGEESSIQSELNTRPLFNNLPKKEIGTNMKKNSDWETLLTKGENYERVLFHLLVIFQLMNILIFVWLCFQFISKKENYSIIAKI